VNDYLRSLKEETERDAADNAGQAKSKLEQCKSALSEIEEVLGVAENKKADDERVLPNLGEGQAGGGS
jgi:hypothetical protein